MLIINLRYYQEHKSSQNIHYKSVLEDLPNAKLQFTLPYWLQPHPIKFPELPWSSIVIIILFRAGNFRTHLKAHSVEELNKCDQSVVNLPFWLQPHPIKFPPLLSSSSSSLSSSSLTLSSYSSSKLSSTAFPSVIKSLLKRPLTSLFLKNLPAKLAHLARSVHFELEPCERMQQEYIF